MLRRHPVLTAFTVAYLALVGWVTLGPQPLDAHSESILLHVLAILGDHRATAWVDYDMVEFAANVAMFAPLGMLLVLLLGRSRWWLAVLCGIALTCGIEFVQRYLPDRVSDPRDILANSVGALAGALLVLAITYPKARRAHRARRARLAS